MFSTRSYETLFYAINVIMRVVSLDRSGVETYRTVYDNKRGST